MPGSAGRFPQNRPPDSAGVFPSEGEIIRSVGVLRPISSPALPYIEQQSYDGMSAPARESLPGVEFLTRGERTWFNSEGRDGLLRPRRLSVRPQKNPGSLLLTFLNPLLYYV